MFLKKEAPSVGGRLNKYLSHLIRAIKFLEAISELGVLLHVPYHTFALCHDASVCATKLSKAS